MTWLDAQTTEVRRRDQLRLAERERLAAYASHSNRVPTTLVFVRPVVSWVGRRLVTLGFRMLVASKEWDTRAKTMYNEMEWT